MNDVNGPKAAALARQEPQAGEALVVAPRSVLAGVAGGGLEGDEPKHFRRA